MVKEKVVVGFEEEVERLIEKLHNRGDGRSLEIISIISPGGGGKTTLAEKVYDHPLTTYTFDRRAWINVSQDYNKTRKRDLLFCILESVDKEKREDYKKSIDDKLGKDIHKSSKEKHEDYENSDDNLGKDIRNLKEKHEDHEKRIDDKLGEVIQIHEG
ncbi:hypothetical protein Vadar_017918 [Vaccinium darrowii]|uniref:Uncharacterized protein n=1 Tax=Vaccinium darrowii TaxID=229202 RepID=A0ACB7Y0K6_9ERIC|nr:hypothetical protein Vadar_017918 [Vaccinium darrowii]